MGCCAICTGVVDVIDPHSRKDSIAPSETTRTKTYPAVSGRFPSDLVLHPNPKEVDLSHFYFETKHHYLGIGGFGLVREAVMLRLSEVEKSPPRFALKSMSKHDLLRRNNGVNSVFQELQCLDYLRLLTLSQRRFLCNLHYAFQDDRYVYLAIDLCTGGDMRYNLNLITGHKFNESTAKFYIAQVFLALDACHSMSILHRDCKPENLILCSNGYLKLTDFGVAKVLMDVDKCSSTSGTHGYIAPEVYTPPHQHGRLAEWFAAGVTLHEFLCGRRPFDSQRLMAFRDPFNADNLEPHHLFARRHITVHCKDFTARCLERFPRIRLGSVNGLEDITTHSWFHGFDWQALIHQTLPAPYIPPPYFINHDVNSEDLHACIENHLNAPAIPEAGQLRFAKFSYNTELKPTEPSSGMTRSASTN